MTMGNKNLSYLGVLLAFLVCFAVGESSWAELIDRSTTRPAVSNANSPSQPNSDNSDEDGFGGFTTTEGKSPDGCGDTACIMNTAKTLNQCISMCRTASASGFKSFDGCEAQCSQKYSSGSSGGDCHAQYTQLVSTCSSTTEEATNSCDDKKDSGMSSVIQQVALVGGQMTASNIQVACSGMGKISAAANAATAAYQMHCQSSVSSCSSACSAAVSYYKKNADCINGGSADTVSGDVQDTQKTCNALMAKVAVAQQAMNNFIQTTAQAQNCASQTSSSFPSFCVSNPTLPGCPGTQVDCSNPQIAATNKVCICSKTPNAPQCLSGQSTSASTSPTTSGGATQNRLNPNSAEDLGGDNLGTPEIPLGPASKEAGAAGVDGKQGAGANFGSSGGGSAGGPNGKGGGGAADPIAVTAGFYGGGGSGGGSSYGRGGSGGGGYGGGAGGMGRAGLGAPNLRQFLPGGQYDPKARGLAGASGPDGITGPNTNIWDKIQNRYHVISPTLMP